MPEAEPVPEPELVWRSEALTGLEPGQPSEALPEPGQVPEQQPETETAAVAEAVAEAVAAWSGPERARESVAAVAVHDAVVSPVAPAASTEVPPRLDAVPTSVPTSGPTSVPPSVPPSGGPPAPPRAETPRGGSPSPWRPSRSWTIAFGIVVAVLAALVAVPRGMQALRPGSGGRAGVVRIVSDPPARAIFLDGVDQGSSSPATLTGVSGGSHLVRLDLGWFGSLEMPVNVRKGQTVELRRVATGAIEIEVADPRPSGTVWLRGGAARMAAPCRFDSVKVGWQEIFYEDDRVPLWQRQVLVRCGETTRVRIANAVASGRAHLRVESWSYREGEGIVSSDGDSVLIDRRLAGFTPWEADVDPGLHGVRVSGEQGRIWTQVVEMPAGASRVLSPRFGMEAWPVIDHQEPGKVLVRGPILLTASIAMPEGMPARDPRLHLPLLDAGVRDLPLSPVDPVAGTYVGIVDPRSVPLYRPVLYYFTVQGPSGDIACSELYTLTAVSELSLRTRR
ncbi:MAG: PEGA domain-containing protein [Candidatus Eisenbacteria bacterium]|nr:PEGA domain-containing protein [Candidatus Eisenbacteria bacterium]